MKKDSRLSAGLHVLRKKTQELEHLSIKVDHQMNRQISVLTEKKEELVSHIHEARLLCRQMENHLKKIQPLAEEAPAPAELSVKDENTKDNADKKKDPLFQFGKSPFIDTSL